MQPMRHPSRGTVIKGANDESLRAIRCEVRMKFQIIYEMGAVAARMLSALTPRRSS
jgi:hypothetical protein